MKYAGNKSLDKAVAQAVKHGAVAERRAKHVMVRFPDGTSRTVSTTRKEGVSADLAFIRKFLRSQGA